MRTNLMMTGIGIVSTLLVSGAVLAQENEQVQVTVQASRIVKTNVGRTSSGVPIVDMSLSYGVSAAGLDLTKHADAMSFEKRISDAAQAACEEIGRQYPDSTPSDAVCVKTAVDKAMPRMHELVAAAR